MGNAKHEIKTLKDYALFFLCVVLPMSGMMIMIAGAFLGSLIWFLIGITLFGMPIVLVYLAVSIMGR